ncbi:MAG: tetratricopeptide repeat protein [Fibrobacterota bacterium]|nr:tetratricopeptide repeat protein [Fibrobacterota bacterium]
MSIQYTADQLQRKFQGSPGSAGFSRLAEVLRTEGRIDEAIQVCQDGLKASPQTLSGYVVLGKALMDAGRMDDARDQFEASLRLDPRCLSAMHFLARIMIHLQWADAAAGYYRAILEVEPWDAEIRALLREAAPESRGFPSAQPQSPETKDFAPATSYDYDTANAGATAQDETFEKPDGFAGDVLEVNLNDLAADFLPSQDSEFMEPGEESLEDALSGASEERPRYSPAPIENIDTRQGQVEPQPKDILRDEPIGQIPAMENEPPPISGQDVEDRLNSLFGSEETPSPSPTAQTSGWSLAPVESPAPELSPSDYANAQMDPSATVTGEMRKVVDDVFPPAADLPTQAQEAAEPEAEDRVQGDDIEKRLDELFNLTESDILVPAAETFVQATDPFASPESGNAPIDAASLPMVRGPKVEEAVSLGEVVSFGGDIAYREADATPSDAGTAESKAEELRFTPETTAPAQPEGEIVTGQDVADKLDNLFGEEPVSKSGPVTDAAAGNAATQVQAREEYAEATPFATKPWRVDPIDGEHPMPPTGEIMSTESMLPPGWFGELEVSSGVVDASSSELSASSGEPSASSGEGGYGPQITGADVEVQLDKLFHIEEDGETVKGAGAVKGNLGDTVSFQSPFGGFDERPAGAMPGDESDRTVLMPAMGEPTPPKDTSRIKKSVADWLARRSDDADQRTAEDSKAGGIIPPQAGLAPEAGETMILPAEDFNSTLELPSTSRYTSPESPFAGAFLDDPDAFGTLAPEDLSALSETTSIEMIDGEDVAERLDELFSDEGTATVSRTGTLDSGTEMSLFIQENGEALEMPALDTTEGMISGEDVSLRLHEIFEPGSATPDLWPTRTESAVPTGMETDDEMLPDLGSPTTSGAATVGLSTPPTLADPTLSDPTLSDPTLSDPTPPVPELAPMTDEEDGYPEEEEMPQSGAGANVATVTLAEIYFQQGLREQALQIYRQLLEREPENDSVRKRIEEIEATKSEGEDSGERDAGSNPRRPRPGLKVPKRKK